MMPRIWTRLFVLTILAVVLTWIVIGLSVRALQEADIVVAELDKTHIPALTQTSDLSAQVAELAIRSNELLLVSSMSDSPIETMTDDLSRFLLNRLDNPRIQEDTRRIVDELDAVARMLARMRRLEAEILGHVERLRWINLELEEETAAFVADFSFNIQAQTQSLVIEETQAAREAKAVFLQEEIARRDALSDLASELTRLSALAFQIANGSSEPQLDQLFDILSDTLSNIDTKLEQISSKSEFLTIHQTVVVFRETITSEAGLVAFRQEWVSLRNDVQNQLEAALQDLSDVQLKLQADAASQRDSLSATIATFSKDASQKRLVLLVATVVALLGGLGILFLYIRPVIIRPMQELTGAMKAIVDGQAVDVSDVGNRHDEIGQLSNAVQAFRTSVRDRDQAIVDLRSTQNELVQAGKMAALGTLSAGIGHELNQPLGAMKQRLHLLRAAINGKDSTAQSRQATKIAELADRMEQIILHLKRFARRSEHRKENVPLAPLVRSASALMQSNLKDRQISLDLDPSLKDIVFLGDPVLIEQVIVNLLSNASDAIAETDTPGEIRIDVEAAADGQIAFSIADTGIGLGDLDPLNVVEPFVTSKVPGAGLGLGLSISYNILTGLGGDLNISRRSGRGVRATVTLLAGERT